MSNDNFTQFGGPAEIRVIHIAEMLVALHDDLMMPDDIFTDREQRHTPNGDRIMMFPPTKSEAHKETAVAMMDMQALTVLNKAIEGEQKRLLSLPKHTEREGITSIITHDQTQTMQALVGGSFMLLTHAIFEEALAVIDRQYPQVKQVDVENLDFLVFSINELQAENDAKNNDEVARLKKEVINLFQKKVDDLRTRHFGSEWVHVKIDHGLATKMEARIIRVKKSLGMRVDDEEGSEPTPPLVS